MWFRRCDGRIFYFDEITQANASPNVQYTEINAGWSLFPVAYLPGQSTMEISMTSGQFNADLFALANGSNFKADAAYTTYTTEHLTVDATSHSITLTNTPVAHSISIGGMVEGTTAGAGTEDTDNLDTFAVAEKVITLPDDVTGEIEVSYEYVVTDAKVAEIDNQTSAIGEAVFKWPVYNSGEDCTDASIKGYVIMKVYRCRVSQMPGFDTSYKSAA